MLYDSERKLMQVLWKEGSIKATDLAKLMNEKTGWNRNTTYTIIKKCTEKNLIKRSEPGYICSPLVSRKQIQKEEAQELLERSFNGNIMKMFSVMTDLKPLSKFEVKEIRRLLKDKLKDNK